MAQFGVLKDDNQQLTERYLSMAGGLQPLFSVLARGEVRPTNPLLVPEFVVDQCRRSWRLLKDFVGKGSRFVASSVLALAQSHFPRADFKRLESGRPADTSPKKFKDLQKACWGTACVIADKIELVPE